jgi:putative ABC transport system substrate-binding protein
MRPLNAAAAKLGVKAHTATVSNEIEIEQTIAKLAREPGGGLVVMADSFNYVHRKLIIALTARHKVAAIYGVSKAAEEGGLVSYVADPADLCRRAAPYVDRILRGEKPNNLPVQQPNKFELVVNKKTAKELGLKVPESMLIRADRVIE